MSRPVGPPPYTAEEIALLDTPEKRFIAQAELNSTSTQPLVRGTGELYDYIWTPSRAATSSLKWLAYVHRLHNGS